MSRRAGQSSGSASRTYFPKRLAHHQGVVAVNQSRIVLLISLTLGCLIAFPASAGEGFKWPSLNPFSSKKKSMSDIGEEGTGTTTIPSAGGSIDDDPPKTTKTTKTSKAAPAKPSTWQKLNSGTQAFFAKSTSMLNPWGKKKTPATPVTGTRKTYNGSSITPKPPEKKPFYSSLFGASEKKKKEPETVNEFIGQPRVPF
jgi:hypothetical protein